MSTVRLATAGATGTSLTWYCTYDITHFAQTGELYKDNTMFRDIEDIKYLHSGVLTHICVTRPQWINRVAIALSQCGRSKLPPFCSRHFHITFVHEVVLFLFIFHWNLLPWAHLYFTEICSHGTNWQYGSFGSDNGLAPIRRQAIIWTNDGLVYWRIYTSPSLDEQCTIRLIWSFGHCRH